MNDEILTKAKALEISTREHKATAIDKDKEIFARLHSSARKITALLEKDLLGKRVKS